MYLTFKTLITNSDNIQVSFDGGKTYTDYAVKDIKSNDMKLKVEDENLDITLIRVKGDFKKIEDIDVVKTSDTGLEYSSITDIELEEKLNTTLSNYLKNSIPYVIEIGSNDNGYYKKWNNGLIEQWGNITEKRLVTFPLSFKDTNYCIQVTRISTVWDTNDTYGVSTKSMDSCTLAWYGVQSGQIHSWYAIGY